MTVFTGTVGNDTADAAAGTLSGFTGGTLASLQDSIGDSITGLDGNDYISASTGNDTLRGGIGQDYVNGGDGNDTIQFINGELIAGDTVDGGAGTDTLALASGTATIDLSGVNISNVENLVGLNSSDSIGMTAAQFQGFSSINTASGTDTIRVFVDGNSDLTFGAVPVLLGVDRLQLVGGAGNDTLTITSNLLDTANLIDLGGGASDTLIVENTASYFSWDNLLPGSGIANVESTIIDDQFGSSTIDATNTSRSFQIFGNGGDDSITAYTGSDTISGGSGNDTLNGGSVTSGGNDTVIFSGPIGNYTIVNLGGGLFTITDNVGTDGTDRIVNFEFVNFGGTVYSINSIGGGSPPASVTFTGSPGNNTANAETGVLSGFTGGTLADLQDGVGDVYYTSSGIDYISGGAGGDTIYASAGADTIIGNDGADVIYVGTGDFEAGDYINGLAGIDTLIATGTVDFTLGFVDHFGRMSMGAGGVNMSILSSQIFGNGVVTISGGTGEDTLNIYFNGTGSANKDFTNLSVPNIENINIIDSVNLNNSITGSTYNDSINAAGGFDTVNGGNGNDTIRGGAGNDSLNGAAGTDTAAYAGPLSNFTVTSLGNGTYTIVDNIGNEGSDTVSGIEFVNFNGTTYDITALTGGNQSPAGVNDSNAGDPVVEAGGVANGTPGDATASGNVLSNDSDPNAGDTIRVTGIRTGTEAAGGAFTNVAGATTIEGTYGTLVINIDGTYTYTLNDGDADTQALKGGTTATDVFSYQLQDTSNASDVAQITITIDGSNDTAVIGGTATGTATEDAGGLTTGALTVSDADSGEAQFQTTPAAGPSYGTFTIDAAGNWTYDPNDANAAVQALGATGSMTDTITVRSVDGTTQDIVITINGVNDAPAVASPITDRNVEAGQSLSFTLPNGTFNDVDTGDTLALTATLANGDPLPAWLTFNSSTGQFSGTPGPGDVGVLTVRVTARDGSLAAVFDDFDITVAPPVNDPPVFTSGNAANFAENGAGIVLDVNAVDSDGPLPVVYGLSGIDAGAFSIDAGTGQITFLAPPDFEAPGDAGANNVYNVTVSAFDGDHTVTQALTITVTDQQNVINDIDNNEATISGTALEDTLNGRNRADLLSGLDGDDSLNGGSGSDTLIGGAGNDTLNGGNDTDWVSYASGGAVTIDLATSTLGGAAAGDVLISIERYIGSSNDDTFIGNSSSNYFYGGDGGDILSGAGGKDTLDGQGGNDTISAGTSRDSLFGGAGRDTFNFDATNESGTSSTSRDLIADFVSATMSASDFDVLDLFDIDARSSVAGNDAFTFIGTAAFTADGQIRVVQSGADTIVQINTSGSGSGSEMTILLQNFLASNLSASDFIL
jgi:VCBS repeat-containing protein